MIKRIVGWFVLVPLCAILIVFALANRQPVELRLDPLSPETPLLPSLDIPLFAVIYGALFAGILLGGIAVWFTQAPRRRERRRYKREAERLSRELEEARKAPRRAAADTALAGPGDFLENE